MGRGGRSLLGLDLKPGSVTLAEAGQSGARYQITRHLHVELPEAAYRDGQILDPIAAGKALREALKAGFQPATRSVAVGLSGQAALVRRVAMPRLKPARLRALVEEQGEQWIPFLQEGCTFDLRVVNPERSQNQQEVLITAVPRRYLESVRLMLKTAGLRLAALDIGAMAQHRAAVALGVSLGTGSTALLHMDRIRSRISLVDGEALVGMRNLDAYPAPAEGHGPGWDPAEFVSEVRRSIEVMVQQALTEVKLGTLVTVAPGTLMAELLPLLESELRRALPGRLSEDFRITSGLAELSDPGLVTALGIAVCEQVAPIRTDLMTRLSTAERRMQRISLSLLGVLALGVLGYGWHWSTEMPRLSAERGRQAQKLADLKAALAEESKVAAEERSAKALTPLTELLSRNEPWSEGVIHLRDLLPGEVLVTTIAAEPPKVSMTGTAQSPAAVSALLQAIEDSPHFKSPVLIYSGARQGPVDFRIDVDMALREVLGK